MWSLSQGMWQIAEACLCSRLSKMERGDGDHLAYEGEGRYSEIGKYKTECEL